ncbi:unnamed protein product [Porites evermanni]|uniref:Uncharacterized protein n=1 Tax=Porites evermanni TaxID=104178 RepID=A0ABN8LQM4_9CNID|nr:unnamed protein product [Porites evermanni]
MLRERLSVHLRKLESKVRKNVVHIVNVQLSKPSALCMASDDVLLVADDGLRVIHQVSLERDIVTIRGKSMRTLSNYPTHIESVESMTILESNNGDQSCKEIKRVSKFNELLVFTDIGARDVKSFNPHTNEVVHLAGDGCDTQNDGTGRCCSFIQAHGICCISNTIFVTDAAAGKVKLVVSMSGTLSFLYHLGLIYDSFGITCKESTPAQMTPELVVSNVRKVHQYVQSTLRKVKESDQLKEDASTNGPQGTVSKKTHTSIELLLKGMTNLMINLEK